MAYVGQLLYVAAIGCVKISLLLFLQRVFPLAVMRRIVRGVLLFVLCFTVTNIFLFAFQCDTPEYYFQKIKGSAKEDEGICLEPQVVYYPMAAINIVTDVVIWILPVPTVIKARLTRREKLGLLWVFILGGIAVAAAFVRPFYLRDLMEDGDPTCMCSSIALCDVANNTFRANCHRFGMGNDRNLCRYNVCIYPGHQASHPPRRTPPSPINGGRKLWGCHL